MAKRRLLIEKNGFFEYFKVFYMGYSYTQEASKENNNMAEISIKVESKTIPTELKNKFFKKFGRLFSCIDRYNDFAYMIRSDSVARIKGEDIDDFLNDNIK